jgi:hypothetical protein
MNPSRLAWVLACTAHVALLSAGSALDAKTLDEARSSAVGWLEANQNEDGSWGEGVMRPLTTAETLNALARAGRSGGAPAQRAQAWLLNQELWSLDYQARAIRALEASGVDMQVDAAILDAIGAGVSGWGPISDEGVTSLDTALVLAAIETAGLPVSGEATKLAEVFARQRADNGWSGDGVDEAVPSASDRTVSAEVVRALASFYSPSHWAGAPGAAFDAQRYLSTDLANGGGAVGPGSESLELAARLAAIHAVGQTDDDPVTGLEPELLSDSRFTASEVWSDSDPLVNAIGLLALTTKPGATFTPPCTDDWDCDGVLDPDDAFPHDPSETSDIDGDGIGDNADPDADGDGYCDAAGFPPSVCSGVDAFPSDPTEHTDTDSDGIGNNEDLDDDGDGIPDLDEIENGTNPELADSDGDGVEDELDPCPLIADGTDLDGDGVCAPLDECDDPAEPLAASATDIRNLDGDSLCDEADLDDDGDGFADGVEVAWGTDPRDATSFPEDVVASDPDGDVDGDGLTNLAETTHPDPGLRTDPYFADSDGDGALDGEELLALPVPTDPNDPASRPAAKLGVMSSAGAAEPALATDPFAAELSSSELRATLTGGQPTPVANAAPPHGLSSGLDGVSLAGFQPQTSLGRDFDGDGLSGAAESALSTSATNPDTDGDRFADGESGVVSKARYAQGFDLDGDGFVEGEGALGTNPADGDDRAGIAGDVAPLGFPDARLDVADRVVGLRLSSDAELLETLTPDGEEITREAGDLDDDGSIGVGDVLKIFKEVDAATP